MQSFGRREYNEHVNFSPLMLKRIVEQLPVVKREKKYDRNGLIAEKYMRSEETSRRHSTNRLTKIVRERIIGNLKPSTTDVSSNLIDRISP